MEQSHFCESNRFVASQEIPHILWNSKVHCCINRCPPPAPILSQLDPVHNPTSHFMKININIILPYMPGILRPLKLEFLSQASLRTATNSEINVSVVTLCITKL